MSVVGIDFGNLNCYISVARQGGIEVATNDYSLHATPSCVQFGSRQRTIGVAARQSMMMNLKNTVTNFKHLIGRKYSDPIVKQELEYIPCQVVQLPEDNIGFKIDCFGESRIVSPEQVLAIQFTKLRESAGNFMSTKVSDCVLTVPCFWTDVQRRAALDAMQVADLNCLRLLNETAATALAYGIYKQDLPAESEKPRVVAFVDMGYSSTQACIVAFNKGKLKVLGTTWDLGLGGRAFDDLIRNHFRKEFMEKYKIDAKTTAKSWLRLADESEKLKKLMSANSNALPINIECFMNDKDVSGHMTRADFEAMSVPLMSRLELVLTQLLTSTKIKPDDLEGVEIVGGSTRIPMVKEIIKRVFRKDPRTTLNQDESVSRGAALQCAMLSPTFRVREFTVSDAQPFSIKLTWSADKGEDGESEVFSENHPFPFSKLLTFFRKETFELTAKYSLPNHIPYPKTQIGVWKVDKVTPSAEGDSSKVKVKVRINPNGLFAITSANMYEKQSVTDDEVNQDEEMNGDEPKSPEIAENGPPAAGAEEQTNMQTDESKDAPAGEKTDVPPPVKPVRAKIKSIDLPVHEFVTQLDAGQLQRLKKIEAEMQKLDKTEKEKIDAKNALEEYVYEIRDKIGDTLQPYVTQQDAAAFSAILQSTEDWLYGDGEDQDRKVYVDRLTDLKKTSDPIVERYQEAQHRPRAFDQLAESLVRTRKAYQLFLAGDEKYNHLDPADMEKVRKALDEKQEWYEKNVSASQRRQPTDVPAVFVHQIIDQKETFERIVTPILNKPKPKVEPPPEPPKTENHPPADDNVQANGDKPKEANAKMEVD